MFMHQISKDLDKESEEYKWVKNILPTEYLNQLLDQQQAQKQAAHSLDLTSPIDMLLSTSIPTSSTSSSVKNKAQIPFKKKSSMSVDASIISDMNISGSTDSLSSSTNDLANYLESLKVLIININDKGFDCPGMLSEEKVLQEYEYLNTSSTSVHKHCSKRGNNKKRNNEIILLDSSSDKLENLNNQSISSSNDDNDNDDNDVMNQNDDVDDENVNDAFMMQDVVEGLSEFNFSGRDTPIISGRDTPSSYSHEDTRRNVSNFTSQNLQTNANNIMSSNIIINTNNNNNNISNNNNIVNSNLSRLPVTVHKENREDINEKFCKFEINKSTNV